MARCGALAVLVLAAVLVAASWRAGEALMCSEVIKQLQPCLPYATGRGQVTATCCDGVKSVNNAAKTGADRRSTCTCLKDTARAISGLQGSALSSIPSKCGVEIPYAISPNTDCNKVN